MKIGHYSPWLLAPGGIGTYLRRVVMAQIRHGHEVLLFHRAGLVPASACSDFAATTLSTNGDAEMLAVAQRHALDVLHIHTHMEPAAANSASLPVVRTVHGHEPYCPSGRRHLQFPVSQPCPRACHVLACTWGHFVNRCGSIRPANFLNDFRRVAIERQNSKRFFTIAVSKFVREQMIRSGHDGSRIDVILNPAPSAFSDVVPMSRVPVARFVCFGRLVPEKGIDWLLHAVARLDFEVQVLIAGSGPAESFLRALANRVGINRYIEWRGWLNEDQVFNELSRARAVIIPSIWHEPAGLLTSEAAAAGRMVIASRVGGIPEYVDEFQNAVLVEPGDVEGLAAAMRKAASDCSFAEQLGISGRSRVAQLNLESHLERLEEVYQKAITDSTHRPS